MVSLDRFDGSCNNAVDDLSVFIPRKTKIVYDKVFNMTARINEAKNICKCKLHSTVSNSYQK